MRIVLGSTGSVAALLTEKLAAALCDDGHEVCIVPTERAMFFIERARINPDDPMDWVNLIEGKSAFIIEDKYEWPPRWKKGDQVTHIHLREWADVMIIAPITANTLTKCAVGLCDNLLTSLVYCWDPAKPVMIAPAMNTMMWNNPLTQQHLNMLKTREWEIIPPVSKVLACGDEGMGAMAHIDDIVKAVNGHVPSKT